MYQSLDSFALVQEVIKGATGVAWCTGSGYVVRDVDREMVDFFRFRIKDDDYYNSEYLSQGQVNHAGRSFVTTLEHLLNPGLGQLYPEFEDPRGGKKWTNRVLELRQNWSTEHIMTDQEIELALEVARKGFAKYNSSEIASILLTFKNRKHSRLDSTVMAFSTALPSFCVTSVRS